MEQVWFLAALWLAQALVAIVIGRSVLAPELEAVLGKEDMQEMP
jgi:hypothetical protein